jgi:hypothetical protein
VVFGSNAGAAGGGVATFDGIKITGADDDLGFGSAVSGAGDVNADGIDDVIVGAPGTEGGGRAYVLFGQASVATDLVLNDIATSGLGFAINGLATGDEAGAQVSGAGDVNGDGRADVIVGAHFADAANNIDRGAAYVVFGKVGSAAVPLASLEADRAGFAISGAAGGDQAGFSVAGGGDVNGDGVSDLGLGAPYTDLAAEQSNAGTAYVVFGKQSYSEVALANLASARTGFRITGGDEFDNAGSSVSNAGDVNGDGLADVVIGATNAAPGGGASTGRAYVVLGRATEVTTAISLGSLTAEQGFAIEGIEDGGFVGISVASGGDVNGDGLSDLIVGAANPNDVARSGTAYVLFGWDSAGAFGERLPPSP